MSELKDKLTTLEALGVLKNYIMAQLNTLKNTDMPNAISSELAKIVAGAPEKLDTLKELSDWIATHETSAATMNSTIQSNKNNITRLDASLSSLGLTVKNGMLCQTYNA